MGICLSAGQVKADFNGKPCFAWINPPGEGVRYACTSTSSHTVDHPSPERSSGNAWRTRITARRDGEPAILDVTLDSLSEPLSHPAVSDALALARRLIEGPAYAVADPLLISTSTSPGREQAMSPLTKTVTVSAISLLSSTAPQKACTGPLGDLAQPPPPLPAPPCSLGATEVTLRPYDGSLLTFLTDRLDDTHTHTRTDRYSTLLVSGDVTTSHYEVVARSVSPCTTQYLQIGISSYSKVTCVSTSSHTVQHDSTISMTGDAWSTRVTGRLAGGAPLFDVTINGDVSPDHDAAVWQAFVRARQAIAGAVTAGAPVSGPHLLSQESHEVASVLLLGGIRTLMTTSTLGGTSPSCVGELGEVQGIPASLPKPPCPSGAQVASYSTTVGSISSTNTDTRRDVYGGLDFTGNLTASHYELVGEGSAGDLTVPVILSLPGFNSAFFTSELTLTNHGTTDATLSMSYTPAFGGSAGIVTDVLRAGQQRILPDAVAWLKGLGLDDPGTGGTLRIAFSDLSAPGVASATVRTTTRVPLGRAGVAYPGVTSAKLLTAPVFLCGLRQNAFDRSNVALLNAGGPADGDIALRLTVVSGDPANPLTRVLPDVALSPGVFTQLSGILTSNGLSLSNGYVKVERVSGTSPFYAYAVVNDNATSDGSFFEPLAAAASSAIPLMTLPALVETPAYQTELILTNLSPATRTLRFTWVEPTLAGGRAAFEIVLLPGEQQILPAFVQLLRERGAVTDPSGPSRAGALFVTDGSGDLRGVFVGARVLTPGDGGRYGVFSPAIPAGSEASTSAHLDGLQQNTETRTNLALVNVGSVDSSASTFRIDLFNGDSGQQAGSFAATVPAQGFVQIDRVLASYAPGVSNGYALVTRTSGSNPFVAYAIVNDGAQPGQRSGDGAFVPASLPP